MESGTPGPPAACPGGPGAAPDGSARPSRPGPAGHGPAPARRRRPYVAVTEFDRQEEYSRWMPIVKGLLLIPHWFVLFFIWIAAFFAIVGAWFAVLFTGKYPPGIHKFVAGPSLDDARVRVRAFMVDGYPPFSIRPGRQLPGAVRHRVHRADSALAAARALAARDPVRDRGGRAAVGRVHHHASSRSSRSCSRRSSRRGCSTSTSWRCGGRTGRPSTSSG